MKKAVYILLAFAVVSFMVLPSVYAAQGPQYTISFASGTNEEYGEVDPGSLFGGELKIVLKGDTPAEFLISALDMEEGKFEFLDSSGKKRGLSALTVFENGSLYSMDPLIENELLVPFEIQLPEFIPPGDYKVMFGIKASSLAEESGDFVNDQKGKASAGAKFALGGGKVLSFSVSGERTYELGLMKLLFGGFVEDEMADVLSPMMINLELANLGNSMVKPYLDFDVVDWRGESVFVHSLEFTNEYPGATINKSIKLDGVPSFNTWVDVNVKIKYSSWNGKEEIFYEVGEYSLRVYQIPWMIVLPVASMFFLILIFVLVRKYRMLRLKSRSKLYVVMQNDTLQDVCARFGVNPKHVIIVNRLKAPYFLIPGSKIMIPIIK